MAYGPRQIRHRRKWLATYVVWQLPAGWLLLRALVVFSAPRPTLLTAALLAYLNLGLLLSTRYDRPDRPIPKWVRRLSIIPHSIWQAACGLVLLPGLLLTSARLGLPLAFEQWQDVGLAVDSAAAAVLMLGLSIAAYAVLVRRRLVRLRELEVPVAGLPATMDGYRIVQLSDLHVGSFTPVSWLELWVNQANALRPDLIALTGDYLTFGENYLRQVPPVLARLRARDGVVAALGNHDYFTDDQALREGLEANGVQVLRNEGRTITNSPPSLYVAAVDDACSGRADLAKTLADWPRELPCLLLAHDPTTFPEAAEEGVALTLSGHTHGGQVAVPFRGRWSLATRTYPHSAGLYREGASSLFVSRGLGTTGLPVRLGAAPEIVVLILRSYAPIRSVNKGRDFRDGVRSGIA